MSLTEFLLARIAEDERRATHHYEARLPGGQPVPGHTITKRWVPIEGKGMVEDESFTWTVQFGPQQAAADDGRRVQNHVGDGF